MRDDEARALDIVEACDHLIQHVGQDRARFESDALVQAASQRWLEIIGEAAARLSAQFRADHPEISWRELIGMRNILAHGYFHVDLEVMWTTITRDVPDLREALTGRGR